MMVDQRILGIQGDPQQVRSINEFTDSLGRELAAAEGTPGKSLTRELLAGGLRRALDLGGPEPKRRFLEALSGNIHKFPLQEQRSLSRVYPVEISSEYRNLASFVEDAGAPEDDLLVAPGSAKNGARMLGSGDATLGADASSAASSSCPPPEVGGPLQELRKRLIGLPQKPGHAADELAVRLRDEETAKALECADARRRTAFFGEVRLSLFKFPEAVQKELCEEFKELRTEVARLVESMTQEISRWLDEERASVRNGGSIAPLLPKVKALFQAVLSPAFSATFKHLGSQEKRGKETFLLKLALCLRAVGERAPSEAGAQAVLGQASQLRKQFFHVEGYGELMEEWLQGRVKQFNEKFASRAGEVLSSSSHPVLSRLRRTFRPGRWLSLSDPQVEEDLFALFLDDAFPRHVLTHEAMGRVLRQVSSYGGPTCDFHVYCSAARLPPSPGSVSQQVPQDAVESSLLQVLHRLPQFPPLRRLRPGRYLFGRLEVEFMLRGTALFARRLAPPSDGSSPDELPADEFFAQRGPEEFPNAAALAVRVSQQSPSGAQTTLIEDASVPSDPRLGGGAAGGPPGAMPGTQPCLQLGGAACSPSAIGGGPVLLNPGAAPLPLPTLPTLPTAGAGSTGPSHMNMGLTSLPRGPARYQPYPSVGQGKFGLDDEEI